MNARVKHVTAGVDEAGRGPLAGPVVCAAVILKPNFRLRGLDDSNQHVGRELADHDFERADGR